MNAKDLLTVISRDSITATRLLGVYSVDTLPPLRTLFPYYIIVNTAESRVMHGHWVLLYFVNSKRVVFFDSYGRNVAQISNSHYLTAYLSGVSVEYNCSVLQCKYSNVCGYYCLCRGVPIKQLCNLFQNNVHSNDSFVVKIVSYIYACKNK